MKKKIVIPYFPIEMKYATILSGGASIYLLATGHPIWGAVLLLLSGLVLTTEYVTEINLDEKKISDYVSVLWIPLNNEVKRYNAMQKIIITKGNHSQMINTRVQSRQFDWTDFTGSLIFDNSEALDLLTRRSKHELVIGLKEFATFLNVNVEDHTTNHPYTIDLDKSAN